MAINEQRFENIFTKTQEQLHKYLVKKLKTKYGYAVEAYKKSFIYAVGDIPVMLVAHLDTVHKDVPSMICKSSNGCWMAPEGIGGDDRCGVEMILSILDTGRRPHVLFTHDEEVGGIGAEVFVQSRISPKLSFIVEFDRVGKDDAVFYSCDNPEFVRFVEGYGFKEHWGTFSDISVIAQPLKAAAVNLSSGYHNPHQRYEYVSIPEMNSIFEKSLNLIDDYKTAFEYIEEKRTYDYHKLYSYDNWISDFSKKSKTTDSKNESRYSHWDYDDEEYDLWENSYFVHSGGEDIALNEVGMYDFIFDGDDYAEGCDGDYFIDQDGVVYEDTVYGLIVLPGAQAFDASGNPLKFNESKAIVFNEVK